MKLNQNQSKIINIDDNIIINKNHIEYRYKITNIPKEELAQKKSLII